MNPAAPAQTPEYTPPELGARDADPWIESRPGLLFFVNALLASPILMTLYPVTLRFILRWTGILDRPSRVLDPVPAVAAHFLPVLGWLALPAFALVLYNLQIIDRVWARRGLWLFALVHMGTLVFTVRAVL